jgi:hypothetical protein
MPKENLPANEPGKAKASFKTAHCESLLRIKLAFVVLRAKLDKAGGALQDRVS